MAGLRAAVVGGGILGLAVAREILARSPGSTVVVYEKETAVAAHQSGHNSGVVHAGLYYEPGSLKAVLCRRGVELLRAYAAEKGLPYEECGKIVVAERPDELERLRAIHARATENGVPGLRLIGAREMAEIEPHATGLQALHSPHTAITDYPAICRALAADVASAGGQVRLGCAIRSIRTEPSAAGPALPTLAWDTGSDRFDLVVACAGLQSDRLARASGEGAYPRVVPFFGDYFLLAPERRFLVNGLVYPVPDPRYPFLGVHLTKRIDGAVTLGPNAFLALGREAYRRGRPSARDLAEVAGFGGFWRFASRNLPAAGRELRSALSTRAFVEEARRYVPELRPADVTRGPRGIRAQAMAADGRLEDDFVIAGGDRVVHVRNAPSPGATSSLAIAEHVVGEVLGRRAV